MSDAVYKTRRPYVRPATGRAARQRVAGAESHQAPTPVMYLNVNLGAASA